MNGAICCTCPSPYDPNKAPINYLLDGPMWYNLTDLLLAYLHNGFSGRGSWSRKNRGLLLKSIRLKEGILLECENCNAKLMGEFCHICGQSGRPVPTGFLGFLRDLFANLLGADSRVVRSLSRLIFFPGYLTLEWVEGHRTRFTSPVQLYLLLAGSFFLLNAYSPFFQFNPENHFITSSLTGAAVGGHLTETHLARLEAAEVSLEVFKERFDSRVSALLGPLLIVIVILFSLLAWAVNPRGYPYAHHAVFSLHWCSFFLLLEQIHRILGKGMIWESGTSLLAAIYLVVAVARVYGGWVRAVFVGPFFLLCFQVLVGLWMSVTLWLALP